MRKAIDEVLEEKFTFYEDDDICRLSVAEALAAARERVGIRPGEAVKAVIVGDGRTMGINALKTTTYICIRLVRTGLGAEGDKNEIIPIAIVNSGEKYETLQKHLAPLTKEMEQLQQAGEVEWFLGGDMKWINMVSSGVTVCWPAELCRVDSYSVSIPSSSVSFFSCEYSFILPHRVRDSCLTLRYA
jgi:hypothetical protein